MAVPQEPVVDARVFGAVSELTFEVVGTPVPKARPRTVTTKTGRVMTYTPESTRKWEAAIADGCRAAIRRLREAFEEYWPNDQADYELTVMVYRVALRGDLDNYVKAVSDGLNGVAFPDDRFIVRTVSEMRLDRVRPRVVVRIKRKDYGTFWD